MRGQKYDASKRFLVMNCRFIGPGTAKDFPGYSHHGLTECVKENGVAAQGKTNPQFDFADHVVVEHDGNIYDPSYGVGPMGQRSYEQLAIAGVGHIQFVNDTGTARHFSMSDGTPQFMSSECGRGFIEDEITEERSFSALAAFYGVPERLLFEHPYNRDLRHRRISPTRTVPGDVVLIPRDMTLVPMLWARHLKPEPFA